jgi:hypothetical protein
MKIPRSHRARGSNRGGCGGGYEITDPDFESKKLAKLRQDYLACPPEWRERFAKGLSKFELNFVTSNRPA